MHYHLTEQSSNKKTGPIPVVTADRATCPTSCPLLDICYASLGPLGLFWRELSAGRRGISFPQLLTRIKALPRGQLWRYGQAGDLPGTGDTIDPAGLSGLVRANRGRPVLAYTHKPAIPGNVHLLQTAAEAGFHVNLSADGPGEADRLLQTGLSVVTLLTRAYARKARGTEWLESLSAYRERTRDLPRTTPGGTRIAVCPATYTETTCLKCRACAQPRPNNVVIGFPSHSAKSRTIDEVVTRNMT